MATNQTSTPPTWAECDAALCKPGSLFELDTVEIKGRPTTVWKNSPTSFRDFLLASLAKYSDRVFLNAPAPEPAPASQREDLTFAQVRRQAVNLAAWLSARGVKQGSLVGLVGWNSAGWVVSFVAIQILGAVPVMVNAAVQPDSMVHCLRLTKPVLVLADATSAVTLAPHTAELKAGGVGPVTSWQDTAHLGGQGIETISIAKLDVPAAAVRAVEAGEGINITPESDAVVFFTSGTTGYPKAVISGQRAALHNSLSSWYPLARMGMRQGAPAPMVMEMLKEMMNSPEQNVLLMAVPFFHVTGCLSILVKAIGDGNKLVTMRRWDVPEAVRIMVKYKVNVMTGVPVTLLSVMQSKLLPKGHELKFASYGGAPPPERMPGDIKRNWPEIMTAHAWGMTETNALHTVVAGDDYVNHPKSAGPSIPVNETRIVNAETRRVLPTGTPGIIEARGMNIMKGYYNDPVATAKTFSADGWLDTGDVGWMDVDGSLYISDRAKDIIIRGAENISSEEVENAVYKDDRIAECAAVPVPDDILGELVACAVSLNPGAKATGEDVIQTVWKRVRSHARPVFVYVADAPLPRNANGKLIKTEIKKIVQDLYAQKRRREAKL